MGYIYVYVNMYNGKRYIGQTNNIERRKREHRSYMDNKQSKNYNYPLYRAFRKYGEENFIFSILEETDFLNEREEFYIKKYKTTERKNGYNIHLGGNQPINTKQSLSLERATEIKQKLKEQNSYDSLVEEYKISKTLLSNINLGLSYYTNDFDYPIQNHYKTDKDYTELLILLKETNLSFAKIAKQLDMGVSTVKKINYGQLRKGLSETYPIRPYTRKPVSTIPKA